MGEPDLAEMETPTAQAPGEVSFAGGPPAAAADHDLIGRCLQGDERSWEALIRKYAGLIDGVAARYGLHEQDRADVFQAVCVELWRNLPKIKDRGRLAAWLATVAGRVSWQTLKARRSWQQRTTGDAVLEESPDDTWRPEELLVLEERWSTLTRAVGALQPRCRQLVWALFFDPEHPSYETVAQRLEMPKDSIGPTRLRCLRSLRQALDELLPASR